MDDIITIFLLILLVMHAYVARMKEEEIEIVETMIKSGARPHQFLSTIKSENHKNQSNIRNIYNAKMKPKLRNTEGRSVLQ